MEILIVYKLRVYFFNLLAIYDAHHHGHTERPHCLITIRTILDRTHGPTLSFDNIPIVTTGLV